jgi:putative FmdB family regulatory protein
MPLYDYQCSTCGKHFELMHKMSEVAPPHGPDCSSPDCNLVKQLTTAAGIIKCANPLVSACGKSLPDESFCASAPNEKKEESLHTCGGGGCAMHNH